MKSTSLSLFCSTLLLPVASFAAVQKPETVGAKPNVLIILADDMGYGDAGFNGCKDIPTPHIDSIAANGVRFTQGYVTAPQCAPSRAGLLTGIDQNRFGCTENHVIESTGLPSETKLFGSYLKEAGYRTGLVGKWHLGKQKESIRALENGFDWFYGFYGGGSLYFPAPSEKSIPAIFENKSPQLVTDYLTDNLTDAAIRFIKAETQNSRPFFLYLAYNAPHAPLQAPQEYLKKFEHLAVEGENGLYCAYTKSMIPHPRQVYAAMVSNMDDNIGRVLATLQEQGVEEQTMVIFLSDNGGPTKHTTASNGPLRGEKGDLLEGGIRVPFALQWKGTIPSGQTVDTPVSSLDLLPTALTSAGIPVPAHLEGANLLPLLARGEPLASRTLFWRFPFPPQFPVSAIRQGDFKWVTQAFIKPGGGWEGTKAGLYNLKEDVHEERDLTSNNPEALGNLKTEYLKWTSTLPVPDDKKQQKTR